MLLVGDWGLGIGDCPIPNPQSPIPNNVDTFNIPFNIMIN